MCWGDVKFCQTSTGKEYLEFNERETKTRSGNDPRNVRAIARKMFAVPNNEKCPVKAYKVYAEKRPAEMKTDDAPFYSVGSKQCKILLWQTLVQKSSSRCKA